MISRILIAEDYALLRTSLADSLHKHYPNWQVLEACDGLEAVVMALEHRPDVILMDYMMPCLNGVMAAVEILKQQPGATILLVTSMDTEDVEAEARASGIRGIVTKDVSPTELVAAMHMVKEGGEYFPPRVGKRPKPRLDIPDRYRFLIKDQFTPRESDIVKLMMTGKSTQMIAEELNLSIRTVETHRLNIYKKTGQHNIAGLITYVNRKMVL
ncbi:MAG: response regulator transcription factor [Bacteroidetes bacterium]|nr:response regulator transcription factor [Bacteroidota bacterium]